MNKYIEENTLIEHLTKMLVTMAVNNTGYKTYVSNVCRDIAVNRLSVWLEFTPAADVVERKHGEWAEEGYCPFCKCDMPAFIEDWEWKRCRTPYCPHCGAKMDESEEER